MWRHQFLAARQKTHLLKFDFGKNTSKSVLKALGQALRLAASKLLEIDLKEIACLQPEHPFNSAVLYDTLSGGSGHLAELSNPDYPEISVRWFDEALKLLEILEAFPPLVREREAMRKILTSDFNDDDMDPLEAHRFLSEIGGKKSRSYAKAPPNAKPAGIDSLERTLDQLRADPDVTEFVLRVPYPDSSGLDGATFVKSAAIPKDNTTVVCIIGGQIAVGKILAPQAEGGRRLRIRKAEIEGFIADGQPCPPIWVKQ